MIRKLVPPLWPAVAHAVSFAVDGLLSPRHVELMGNERAARKAVDGTVEMVCEITQRAIEAHVLGQLAELLALRAANAQHDAGQGQIREKICADLIAPAGGGAPKSPDDTSSGNWHLSRTRPPNCHQ